MIIFMDSLTPHLCRLQAPVTRRLLTMKGQKVEAGSVDNLASLHTLDENTLLEEVRARYQHETIYVSKPTPGN